jgi:hypothetical protein
VTAVLEPTTTATGPTARSVGRSARGPVLMTLALVVTGVAVAAYSATGPSAPLDPASYSPAGSHAIAALLADRGVPVRRVETVGALDGRSETTVVVPFPGALSGDELGRISSLPGRLVVVDPTATTVRALGAAVTVGSPVPVEPRRPACDLPAAVRAGDVSLGGGTFEPTGAAEVTGCYASGGRATLADLPASRLTLLGSGDLLTNDKLDERGNASLALGLLGTGDRVQWLLPRPGARDVRGERSLNDLVPTWVKAVAAQLAVAVAFLALWRARGLGRVVPEPLPVVVRAAESVEGRSRLYRAAHARGTAAESLRTGARHRLVRRLGLPVDVDRAALVAAVAARTGRDPTAVDALLYGAAPSDDRSLVRLANDLHALTDALTREVAGS